ncbi:hypothetical protein [Aureispira sp. CCB-E]|uniref:hypothetical protein n=1 Tax=Aureispira sp. CCB-E TaxID=3051121 RepID=UPI0028692AD1|nr:hypothetical protein [Aureispira sp. CCB-E]WMX15284.1 hypothetical protein QP953_02725 [Aureispira sp. CCB-E]
MSTTGTLSEQRQLTLQEPTASTPDPIVKMVEPSKPIEKPTLTTTSTKPEVIQETPPQHLTDTKCTYCKAEAVATLSFRFGLVLVLLAFTYKLIKTAK